MLPGIIPSVGGLVTAAAANTYATWSTTDKDTAGITLSGGNLTVSGDANPRRGRANMSFGVGGKWYWEILVSTVGTSGFGIANGTWSVTTSGYLGNDVNATGIYSSAGDFYYNGGVIFNVGALAASDRLMLAFDQSTGNFWMGKNGTWWNSGNPGTGTSPNKTVSGSTWYPAYDTRSSTSTVNFGASAFTYSVPSGFNSGVYT